MKIDKIIKYYLPGDLNDNELQVTTIIGYMETGKTTLVKTILHHINRRTESFNIYTKDFSSIFRYDFSDYNQQDILNIFIDDAAGSFYKDSTGKYFRSNIVNFAEIRHRIREKIDKNVRINLFIAAQDYYMLKHYVRRSPILIIKPVVFHSRDEMYLLKSLLPYPYLKVILKLAEEVILKKNKKFYSYCLFMLINKIYPVILNKKDFEFDVVLGGIRHEDVDISYIDFELDLPGSLW